MIAALDLGSSKVCCFIARVMPDDTTRVVGIGHQLSRGVKAGAVVDMDVPAVPGLRDPGIRMGRDP